MKQVTKTHQNSSSSVVHRSLLYNWSVTKTMLHRVLRQKPLSKLATHQPKQSQQYSWIKNHSMRRNLWCSHLQRTASGEQCDSSWNESVSRKKPRRCCARRDICSACSSDRIRFSSFRCLCSNSASERACCTRSSQSVVASSYERGLPIWSTRAELFSV